MIKAILSMDLEGGIGKNGTLPWYSKKDLEIFKAYTKGHTVVMGANTWNDPKMPKPLKDRMNVVVTSNPKPLVEIDKAHKTIVPTTGASLPSVLNLSKEYFEGDIWIVGGSSIFDQTIDIIDQFVITVQRDVYDCDVHFKHMEYIYDNFEEVSFLDLDDLLFFIFLRKNIVQAI